MVIVDTQQYAAPLTGSGPAPPTDSRKPNGHDGALATWFRTSASAPKLPPELPAMFISETELIQSGSSVAGQDGSEAPSSPSRPETAARHYSGDDTADALEEVLLGTETAESKYTACLAILARYAAAQDLKTDRWQTVRTLDGRIGRFDGDDVLIEAWAGNDSFDGWYPRSIMAGLDVSERDPIRLCVVAGPGRVCILVEAREVEAPSVAEQAEFEKRIQSLSDDV